MRSLVDSASGHPRLWLAGVALVTALFAAALPRLEIRTDGAAIHPPGSAAVRATAADRTQFHDDDLVLILLRSRTGGAPVDSPAGLAFMQAAHDSLAALPGVDGPGIRSIRNWPDPRVQAAALASAGALDALPETGAEARALAALLRQDPIVRGLLLSEDGRVAALEVPLESGSARRQTLARIVRWTQSQPAAPLEIALLGPVVAEVQLGERVLADLKRLIPAMVAVIGVLLALTLRTPGGVLVPLVEALLVIVWTLGAMALCRVPVTLVTTIMPVVLMAMAITDEIHLLERLQSHLGRRPGAPATAIRAAVASAYHDVRGPIVATSLTTAVGFFSFATSPLVPLRNFGIFTGFGILCAMLLTFTLVPALTVLLPSRWFGGRSPAPQRAPAETVFARHPRRAVLAGTVMLCAAAAGIPRLRVQDAWVDNFDSKSELVQAEHTYNSEFWGSYRWDVVLERDSGFFFRPEGVALLERVERAAADAPGVGGVVSGLAPLARAAAAFGESEPLAALDTARLAELAAMTQMQQDRSRILQLITPDGSAARVRIHLNSADYRRTRALRDALQSRLAPLLHGTRWHSSGDLPVALDVVHAIVDNQIRSAAWAVAGIGVLLLLGLRRLDAALVALAPVTAAALLLLGAMGWVGMPLGIATSMFVSLSIGVGIDFALHMMHHYQAARRAGRPHQDAVGAAIESTGRAIRWNALVLALGLSVLCVSSLKPDRMLGILLATAVLSCWVTTLLFLPALLRHIRTTAVLACLLLPAASRAQAPPSAPAEYSVPPGDPAVERVMHAAETMTRRLPRAVRMQITTQFTPEQKSTRTLWGVVGGDAQTTRLLYVFTKPDPMRGLTLLLEDTVDPAAPDSAWLHLPALKHFGAVGSSLQKTMVPGTALTNDDARGFIPTDRYAFELADSSAAPGSGQTLQVVAQPRTAAIRNEVGYGRLVIRVDEKRSLVERVDFAGADGKPLKTFEVLDAIEVRGTWLPRRARVRHLVLGFESEIQYQYWPLPRSPDAGVFRPAIARELFLPRLERAIAKAGARVEPRSAAPEPAEH